MSLEQVSSLSDFMTVLKTSGQKLVVVDFHATWCGPCHAIAPYYEQLARKYTGRARFLKVDVDEAEDVARHCSISAMPTFHMYVQGRLVSDFSGADKGRLASDIERYAPSSDDVAFAGSGHTLGSTGQALGSSAAASASASAASAPPKVDWNARDTAAAAAAKRMEAVANANAKAASAAAAAATATATAAAATAAAKKADEAKPSASDASAGKASASDASASKAPVAAANDSRLKIDPFLLKAMVDEMGFPSIRAEKALIFTGNKSIERAVEWCFEHADDPDIDEPLQVVTQEGTNKPKLSPEEAKKKADELYARARAKREAEEKKEAIDREKNRLKSGKEVTAAKLKFEEESRKRAVADRKREKLEAKRERERVREMLEADKQRRHEKFKMPGSAAAQAAPVQPKQTAPKAPVTPSAAGGKIQFRLPDGTRIEGEFDPDQTVGDLLAFLAGARPDISARDLTLSQQYPRRKFTSSDRASSLGELNLLPRGALTVMFS